MWIANALAVTASRDIIFDLAQRPDVARIEPDRLLYLARGSPPTDHLYTLPLQSSETIEPNLAMINAPAAWARGITGQGVVVALLDSGVNMDSLVAKRDIPSLRIGRNVRIRETDLTRWIEANVSNGTNLQFSLNVGDGN